MEELLISKKNGGAFLFAGIFDANIISIDKHHISISATTETEEHELHRTIFNSVLRGKVEQYKIQSKYRMIKGSFLVHKYHESNGICSIRLESSGEFVVH